MWWILDLIIVAIICFYILISFKRGFVRTIIELVGYFLSIYLAFTVGDALAETVYVSTVEPAIVETMAENITVSSNSNIDDTVNSIWSSLPDFVARAAENFNVTSDTLRESIKENYNNTSNATVFAESATQSIAKPVLVPIIKALISFLIFIILMFVVKLLAKIINKAFSLPIIGGLNRALGGAIGFFKGAIISTVFVMVILVIISFTEDGFFIFTKENIDQTVLFKFLAGFSPFK